MCVGGVLLLSACSQSKTEPKADTPPAGPAPVVAERPSPSQRVSLEINGLNYTDTYIDGFLVDGQGGGNIFVSTPTSGGGKATCCVVFSPGVPLPETLTVRWTRDNNRWCEAEAVLKPFVPADPQHLGVHFYPDGHIEAEITQEFPPLRLKLERFNTGQRKESGNVVRDEQTARCQDGY